MPNENANGLSKEWNKCAKICPKCRQEEIYCKMIWVSHEIEFYCLDCGKRWWKDCD
jgi:hypothetical protein